jgi:hypothetical protein
MSASIALGNWGYIAAKHHSWQGFPQIVVKEM